MPALTSTPRSCTSTGDARQCGLPRARPLLRRPVPAWPPTAPTCRSSRSCRPTELVESRSAAGAADQPDDGRRRGRGAERCALHDRRHRTTAATRRSSGTTPQRPASDETWQQFVRRVPLRRRGRLPGRGAEIRPRIEEGDEEALCISVSRAGSVRVACAELFRDAGEIMVSPMATMVSIGARLARLTFNPDILLTDGEALFLADTPDRRGRRRSRAGCRSAGSSRRWPGAPPRDDGRHPDRPLRQPEPRPSATAHPKRSCSASAAPRATPSTTDELLGREPLQARLRRSVDIVSGIGWDRRADDPATGSSTSTAWSPTSACSTSTGPTTRCGRCRSTPASASTRWPRTPGSSCTAWTTPSRPAAHRRGAEAAP